MAYILADRVKETTTTTGTGTLTLGGTSTGYTTFSAAVGNANITYYCIEDTANNAWEVGQGTYTSAGNTLSRDVVYASSNAGAFVNLAAGTKTVFVTVPAMLLGGLIGPMRPSNITPAAGATGVTGLLIFVATNYVDNTGYSQSASQWQVSTNVNFSSTVYSSGDQAAVTTFAVSGTFLSGSTTYYWRCRYKNAAGSYSSWSAPTSFTTAATLGGTIQYLAMGSGSGGTTSNVSEGGGSAGNHLSGTTTAMLPGTGYSITVGGGGAGGTSPTGGSVSQIGTAGAIANSAGGIYAGNSGGGFVRGSNSTWAGGGGAGAAANGGNGAYKGAAGAGGAGATWLDGVQRGGGGGGGMYPSGSGASGGAGGGGAGGQPGTAGTANTGSGGGGAGSTSAYTGLKASGAGGSGVVILRYQAPNAIATGGTITSSGGYIYHKFTTSGTFTP